MIVGVYAAARVGSTDSAVAVTRTLSADSRVTGLEIPSHHIGDETIRMGLVQCGRPDWRHSLTCFPQTMLDMAADPGAGLAARDEAVRVAAVTRVGDLLRAASEMSMETAGSAGQCDAVFLHSAPRAGSAEAMERSLFDLLDRFPDGPSLLIEHCDASMPTHPAEKGFLSLTDELALLERCDGRAGMALNWGRSAIEGRSAATVIDQVQRCADAGVLRRVMFSGVADSPTDYAPAWGDGHLPTEIVEPASLLTLSAIRDTLTACGPGVAIGVKISVRPVETDDAGRARMITRCIDDIDSARA